MGLFLDKSTEVLARKWAEYLDESENSRRSMVKKLIDYYIGDQKKYIESYIDIGVEQFPYYWTNITKKVIKRKAQVYKNPPQRLFGDKNKTNPKYEELTAIKNVRMKTTSRQSNLLGVVAVQPIITQFKVFDYFIVRYFQLQFKEDNPLEVEAIRYIISGNEKDLKAKYMVWTKDHQYIEDSNNNIYPVDEKNPDLLNPYGVIPFVFCHSEFIIDDFWNTSGNAEDLMIANEHINLKLSQMANKFQYKSFDPIYIIGTDQKEVPYGYNKAVTITEADAKIGHLSQTHDFRNDVEAIKFEIQLIERQYNLSINWGIEGNPSGFSLIVQNIDHFDDLEDQVDVAREWESNLYDMEKIVAKAHNIKMVQDKMRVNFSEVKTPISQQEKNMKWQFEFDNKISSRAHYIRSENPDISDDEIKQRLKDVADENRTMAEIERPEPTLGDLFGEGE